MSPYWDAYNVIICRYTEVGLKSQKVRTRMEFRLIGLIKQICRREHLQLLSVLRLGGRIIFFFPHEKLLNAISVFRRIIGVYTFSPGFSMKRDYDEVKRITLKFAEEFLQNGDTFALRVKRIQPYPKDSAEIERELGGLIVDSLQSQGKDIIVNLTNAKKRIFLEIREKGAYLYTEIIPTLWGGNPIEPDKAFIVPVTPDIASIVAAQLLIRRGSFITPVVFESSSSRSNSDLNKFHQYIHALAMNTANSIQTIFLDCDRLISAMDKMEYIQNNVPISLNSTQRSLLGIYTFFKLIDRLLSVLNTKKLIKHDEYSLWLKGIITTIPPIITSVFEISQRFSYIHLNPLASMTEKMVQIIGEKMIQNSIASTYSDVIQWAQDPPTSLADIVLNNFPSPQQIPESVDESKARAIINVIPFLSQDQPIMSILQSHVTNESMQLLEKIYIALDLDTLINHTVNQLRIENVPGNIL